MANQTYQMCEHINPVYRDYAGHFYCNIKHKFVIPGKFVRPRRLGPTIDCICAPDCPYKRGGVK